MKYRHDLDGLRALSVLIVILDHLRLGGFSGGFVGVDVFFVISGYVITGSISKDVASDTFSMIGFYERRIRRLLPGLAAVSLLAIIAAWQILIPRDFISFALSIASIGFAVSNILFWSQAGYFDAMAITKPMLHTWSLAVEEQYYLLYPLLFTWLFKAGRKILISTLALLMVVSLIWASIRTFSHPASSFFLMPTRFWELLSGCLVFLLFNSFVPSKTIGFVLTYGGLALIALATTLYSDQTPFPGISALLPVLGGGAHNRRADRTKILCL